MGTESIESLYNSIALLYGGKQNGGGRLDIVFVTGCT